MTVALETPPLPPPTPKKRKEKHSIACLMIQFELGYFCLRLIWLQAFCIIPIFHVSQRLSTHSSAKHTEIINFQMSKLEVLEALLWVNWF